MSNKKTDVKKEEVSNIEKLTSLVENLSNQNAQLMERLESQAEEISILKGVDHFSDKMGDFKPEKEVASFNKENGATKTMIDIVYSVLGVDFKIAFDGMNKLIHIYVPERLSDLKPLDIQVLDDEGEPVLDEKTGKPLMRKSVAEDVRSKVIRSEDGVREWCNTVKDYIVRNFKDKHLKTPEFFVKG